MDTPSISREAMELDKRSKFFMAMCERWKEEQRFQSALALRMHDTRVVGASVATYSGVHASRVRIERVDPASPAASVEAASRQTRYDLVVALFELHHLRAEDQESVAEAIGNALSSGGVFATFDYTLPNVSNDAIAPYIRQQTEADNIAKYGGFVPWLDAHRGWTVERLRALAKGTGMIHVFANDLPAHSGMALASDDPTASIGARQVLQRFL